MSASVDHVRLAQLAKLSYSQLTASVGELEYLLLPDEGVDYLIIRGTETKNNSTDTGLARIKNYWDIVRNLRILPWPVTVHGVEHKGHAGFIRGAVRVAEAIEPSLRRDTPLVAVGHSMGGAVALVTGLLLSKKGRRTSIITFGSPKVFFRKLNIPDCCDITMYRHGRDIITYVPLGRHPVKQTKVGKASRWWPNIADHAIDSYISSISRLFSHKN